MDREEIKNNGHVTLFGLKGIYTLEEVIALLHDLGFKVKISMATKGDDSAIEEVDSSNSVVRR